jgi:hypothetical protein
MYPHAFQSAFPAITIPAEPTEHHNFTPDFT